MAHAMSRVSLSTARPSDAQFAFVSHNPGNSDVQLYCHLFRARHARAVSLSVAKSSLFSRVRLQNITFSCVCNVLYYKWCFWKYEHTFFYLSTWPKCLQFCFLKMPRPSSWTCCCAAVFNSIFWRSIQMRPRSSTRARNLHERHRCSIKASPSASVLWCLSAGPRLKVCCLGQRFVLQFKYVYGLFTC